MKRTCKNCKAFQTESFTAHCLLGYKIKIVAVPTNLGIYLIRGEPTQPCEKPRTNDAFVALKLGTP